MIKSKVAQQGKIKLERLEKMNSMWGTELVRDIKQGLTAF